MTELRYVLGSQMGYIANGRGDFRAEVVSLVGLKLQCHCHNKRLQLITGRKSHHLLHMILYVTRNNEI